MKKFSILALTLVLTTGLMTACTGTKNGETTAPGTDYATTGPNVTTGTHATTPSTAATVPATTPTHTEPTDHSGFTETTDGINTLDPTENTNGKHRRIMPHR